MTWQTKNWSTEDAAINGWGTEVWDDGSDAPVVGVTLQFVGSIVYPQDTFHLRSALIGGSLSRAWASVVVGGTRYVGSFRHEGSGANAVTWNSSLAGAEHAYVDLDDGEVTAEEAAAAWASEINTLAGINCTVNGSQVFVPNGSDILIGAAMEPDETLRGMRGFQRSNFGGAPSTATTYGPVNGTGSVHLTAPASTGRIIGVYAFDTTGSGAMRMGIADGPAYSTTPAAFSNGQEGLTTLSAGGLRLLILSEPQAMSANANKWISFRASGGTEAMGIRNHVGSTPTGQGDLVTNERLLVSQTTSNPATPIYTAGAYTHANPAAGSPFQVYTAVGFLYEIPTAGEYVGDGGLARWIGFHGPNNMGTPVTLGAAEGLDELSDTMRMPIPWDCSILAYRQSLANNAADEDVGLAFYDWTGIDISVYPAPAQAPLLLASGPMGASPGAGMKRFDLPEPLVLSGVSMVGVAATCGNVDGVTPIDTIAVFADEEGAAGAWLTGWVDQATQWSDQADRGGNGVNTQYLAIPGNQPFGDPTPDWPDPFQPHATDFTAGNQPRTSILVRRYGMSAV